MTPTNKPPSDIIDILTKRISGLERQVQQLKNSQRTTVPIYDSSDYPQDAIEGQVAIGTDDGMHFFKDAAWHDIGAFVGDYAYTYSAVQGVTPIPSSTTPTLVTWHGFQTSNPSVFANTNLGMDLSAPPTGGIYIQEPGMYVGFFAAGFFGSVYQKYLGSKFTPSVAVANVGDVATSFQSNSNGAVDESTDAKTLTLTRILAKTGVGLSSGSGLAAMYVAQTSGSDKTLVGLHNNIVVIKVAECNPATTTNYFV